MRLYKNKKKSKICLKYVRVVYFKDYIIDRVNGILLFRMGFVCLNFFVRKYFKGFDFIMN